MGARREKVGDPRWGSGPSLHPDTSRYFRRALETLRDGLGPQELALFARNVLREALAAGLGSAVRDPGTWRLLRALIPLTPIDLLGPILGVLVQGGLGGAAGTPRGGRLLEEALGVAAKAFGAKSGGFGAKSGGFGGGGGGGDFEPNLGVLGPNPGGFGGAQDGGLSGAGFGADSADLGADGADLGASVEGALWELGGWVLGDPVGFCKHPQGSFVVRGLLRALAGGADAPETPTGVSLCPPEGAEPETQEAEPATQGAELPPSFPLLLQRLAEAFENHLLELVAPASASLCLQEALRVLHRSQSEACARLCDAVIGRLAPHRPGDPESSLVAGLQDPWRGRLLEAAMTVGGAERLRRLFREQLRGRLPGVAAHPLANHGLQRLLDHAPQDVVGEVLRELGPALRRGHPGVIAALMGACRRHPPLQQEALRHLRQAFGCGEPPNQILRVDLLAKLRPPGGGADDEGAETPVTLQGSLLLQHLLHFRGAEPAVLGGFRALPRPAMAALALTPPGSRLWDALMTSPAVPPPARRRLARRLKGHLSSLARHRSGSRVIDAVWAAAAGPTRAAMARELAPQLPALSSDPYGRGVARRLELELFLRRPRLWEQRHLEPRPPVKAR